NRVPCGKPGGQLKQFPERGEGPGANYGGGESFNIFRPRSQKATVLQPQCLARAGRPLDAALARFDEHDAVIGPCAGEHEARHARPAPEVYPRRCSTWNNVEQLQAVGKVALPDRRQAVRRHEVLPLVLLGEHGGEALEPRDSAGIGGALGTKRPCRVFSLDHAASAFRRAKTSSAASAAGVTPRTLPAAARLAGRAAARRSTISLERPGTSANGKSSPSWTASLARKSRSSASCRSRYGAYAASSAISRARSLPGSRSGPSHGARCTSSTSGKRSHSASGRRPAPPRTGTPERARSDAPTSISRAADQRSRSRSRSSNQRMRSVLTQPVAMASGVSREAALLARKRRRYSARAVNIR